MRIVVVSDSHKDFYSLQKAVLSQSSAEVVVFCGDGNEDMDTLAVTIPDKMMLAALCLTSYYGVGKFGVYLLGPTYGNGMCQSVAFCNGI